MLALSGTKFKSAALSHWMGKLDIRAKVLTLFALSLSLIFLKNPIGLAFLGGLSTLCLLSVKRYRLMLIVYLVLALTWVFSLGCLWLMGFYIPRMAEQTLAQTLVPFLRMWPLLNMALTVSLTMETGRALVSLKQMRLPRIIYLPVMVALRFIPGFFNDLKQLRECLLLRGIRVDFKLLVCQPMRTMRLLVVPMVIRALRLADELAVAAELKQVGYGTPTATGANRFRWCDSGFVMAGLLALVIAWNLPGEDVETRMGRSGGKPATTQVEATGHTQ